jgi:ABC-type polysaccharide/polyol phosphate transport system ATPase subunit
MSLPILEVDAVSKSFAIPRVHRATVREHLFDLFRRRPVDELRVLADVSFSVERGETFGIMGRNGGGKSTLLKILAGIYRPDSGDVRLHAPITPILELGVGWNPELDAIDNILLIGSVMGMSLAELRGSIDDILSFAELERFANLKLEHYSTGMAARLAYAIAFRAVREILLLDEIFAVGDGAFQARCQQRYRELSAAGHTMILVSHAPEVITEFCDRAILLDGGRIVAEGAGAEVACKYEALMRHASGADQLALEKAV